jgi:hypothetical protein
MPRVARGVAAVRGLAGALVRVARERVLSVAWPLRVVTRLVRDLVVTPHAELALRCAAFQAQLESASRQGRLHRSQPSRAERALLAALLPRLPDWKEICYLVQPATVLKWHREGFKILWAYRSRPRRWPRRRRVTEDVARLVQHMGRHCRTWGAERIRGELGQLEVHHCKRTVQRLLAERGPRLDGPTWGAFWRTSILPGFQELWHALLRWLRRLGRLVELLCALVWAARGRPSLEVDADAGGLDEPDPQEDDDSESAGDAPREGDDPPWAALIRQHLDETWACDFFTVVTVDYELLYVFFVLELGSRTIRHWNVTQNPTRAWTTQQFREATAWSEGPRFLIRDRDGKFSAQCDDVLHACGTEVLLTSPRRPIENCFAERWVRVARDELFHHVLVWGEHDLRAKMRELVEHYHARPHQGLGQRSPNEVAGQLTARPPPRPVTERVGESFGCEPALGGLHRRYHRAA